MKIHELLGIDPSSTEEVVRKTYRFNCPHPDRGGTPKEFILWNRAFQEWEESLIEETRLQQYVRDLTRQAMIKSYKNNFMIDFTIFMQAIVNDAISACQENIDSILTQEQSFKDGIVTAGQFKSEEVRLVIISELERQLKNVPDLLDFQKSDLAFYKEAKKAIQLNKTPVSQPQRKAYLGTNNCS